MIRQVFTLLMVFPRLIGMLAIGALDSLAIVLGLRWRGPDGRSHWKGSLR